ncbi:MAG: hypothetical protein COB24_00785 [Hyphomicrobiales bacterium]|nr:MAG: hypothetical protein COB24_00785 [Hyphomicrobiales bacterium]
MSRGYCRMKLTKLTIKNSIKQICLVALIVASGLTIVNAKSQELKRSKLTGFGTYSGHFLAANLALSNRDFKNATRFLINLYSEQPDDPVLIESLFLVHLINGEFEKARLFAMKYHQNKQAIEQPESSHHYLSKLFLTADQVKLGDYNQARSHLAKGDDFMIAEMSYYLLSTWINFADNQPEEAIASLEKLQENSFHQIYYLINSAILAEMQDRQKDADIFYNEALLLGGTKLDLIEAYGRFLERTGREKQAFALYDDFENRAGKHPLIDKARARLIAGDKPEPMIANAQEAIAYNLYHIANIYYGAGNYDEALNYGRLGQYLAPENSYILNILSLSYQNVEKYVEANVILEQIKADSPFYTKAQIRIAANLEINGQNDLALEKVAALLTEDKIDEAVYMEYANMLKRNEKYAQSVEYYDGLVNKLMLLTINDANLFYNRAVAHERLKNWPQAEADFLQALKLDPNHSYALNYLGYSWVDKGMKLEQGLEMINTALVIDPQNAFIIDSLGWAYFKLGRYEEARLELERAMLVSPSNADISDHLGDVYWKLGRKLEAEFKWQQATIFKSPEINYDDLEYKRENGLDALDRRKSQDQMPAVKAENNMRDNG